MDNSKDNVNLKCNYDNKNTDSGDTHNENIVLDSDPNVKNNIYVNERSIKDDFNDILWLTGC